MSQTNGRVLVAVSRVIAAVFVTTLAQACKPFPGPEPPVGPEPIPFVPKEEQAAPEPESPSPKQAEEARPVAAPKRAVHGAKRNSVDH